MKRQKLGDACSRLSSGKSIRASEINSAGSYPVIGGNGLRGYADHFNFDGECAVIGRQGAACGNIRFHSGKAYITEHAVVAVADECNDSRYLAYLLSTMHLGRLSAQSAQPGLSVKTLSKQEVDLPSLEVQKQVVRVLGALDDKIEANAKLNGYLEELADGMFRRRFGGLTDNATLADFANVTMGQSPAGSSYNEAGIGTIFYQGRAEFGWRYPTQRLSTTEPKRMAKAGDVLMSVRAPVGDLNLAYEDCCIGRGLAAIHCDYPSYGLYLMRSLHKKLDAYNGEGTVFGSINGKALNGLPIVLPNNAAIRAFEKEAAPIDTQIRNNEVESRALVTLRDTLLPKLMSGEIDVSKVDLTQLNSHLVDYY